MDKQNGQRSQDTSLCMTQRGPAESCTVRYPGPGCNISISIAHILILRSHYQGYESTTSSTAPPRRQNDSNM